MIFLSKVHPKYRGTPDLSETSRAFPTGDNLLVSTLSLFGKDLCVIDPDLLFNSHQNDRD